MNKILGTIIFTHIPTGNTLKTFTGRFVNKYFFEKEKRDLLIRLMKAKDIPSTEIDVEEYIEYNWTDKLAEPEMVAQ